MGVQNVSFGSVKEGLKHIVFLVLWQLPDSTKKEIKFTFTACKIQSFHFATEKIRIDTATNTKILKY